MLNYCSKCHTVLGCSCVSPEAKQVACVDAKAAIWAHVLDPDNGLGGVLVAVSTQGSKASAVNGFAQFPDLNGGTYEVSIPEEDNEGIAEDYVLPTEKVSVNLAAGQVAYVDFQVTKKGEIVAVVQLGAAKLSGVPVKISGEEGEPPKTGEDGKANLGKRAPKGYDVEIAGDKHPGSFEAAKKTATVESGKVTEVVFDAVAKVKATITADDNVGWFHAETPRQKRIKLTLAVEETLFGDPSELYEGKVELGEGLDVFDSADAEEKRVEPLTVKDLRGGKDVWVIGPVSKPSFAFTLAEVDGFEITQAEAVPLEIKEVDVITPKITGSALVLLHHDTLERDARPLEITFEHSAKEPATEVDATWEVTGTGKVALYTDDTLTTALTSPFKIGKKAVYLKGTTEGEATLTVNVADALPEVSGGKAEHKLYVAKLEIQVHEQKTFDVDAATTNWLATREVYQFDDRYGPGVTKDVFPRILVRIKKPADELWTYAKRINLVLGDTVKAYEADDGTDEYPKSVDSSATWDGGFETPYVVALKDGGGDPEWDTAVLWVNPGPGATAAAVTATACTRRQRPIALSLTSQSDEELKNAAKVELTAFSFDQDLDRLVMAECRTRLNGNKNRDRPAHAVNKRDVAIAKAGGHRKLPRPMTDFRFNRVHTSAGESRFDAFNSAGTTDDKLDFIEEVYSNAIKTALHANTRAAIKKLLEDVEFTGDGTAKQCGVPGLHAEVIAVNDLLNQDIPAEAISVATYKLKNLPGRGERFPTCRNCNWILRELGVRGISGWDGMKVGSRWVGRGF